MEKENNDNTLHIQTQIREAKDALVRITSVIWNCDTKAGMGLAISGVISIVLVNSGVIKLIIMIYEMATKKSPLWADLFSLAITISSCFFLSGMFKLTCAISARVSRSKNSSKFYFADIDSMDLENYMEQFKQQSDEDILNDLLTQVHVSSKICVRKFGNFNSGLKCVRTGVICFLFSMALSYIAFS